MSNSFDWKRTTYILIALMIGALVGFLASQLVDKNATHSATKIYEITPNDVKKGVVVKAKIDSVAILKLQNEILLVEKKNDGRFEVLTWSSVLVMTLLLVFITVNFIVSSSKVREIVDIEIDKRTEDIKKRSDDFVENYARHERDMQALIEESEKEFEKMKNLVIEYEQTIKSKSKK
jgi:uncharacterized membrane-anchored protein YhcB (DUF1043 family)